MASIDDVTDVTPRVQFTAAAAQTDFDYPFPIFQDADLVVIVDGVTEALGADYTVSGEGEDTGGTVTFLSALTGGEVVTIYRDIAIERTSDFQQNGPFTAATLNDELDRLTLVQQEIKALLQRCLRLPVTTTAGVADTELSPVAAWANKYLSFDSNGVPEPAALTSATVTQSLISQLLNPQTTAEAALGLAVVNNIYLIGQVDRYGTNTIPGTTDMTAAVNAAFKLAKNTGHDVSFGANWPYLVTSPINATQDVGEELYGYAVRNFAQSVAHTENAPGYPCVLANHSGHVFDCSGASAINWYDVSVGTPAGASSQKTVWFLARNASESSQYHRFHNCRAFVSCSEAVLYNYGSEDGVYTSNVFYNTHGGANAKVVVLTAHNIRSLSSTFITIATGQQSTLDHEFIGGQYVNRTHSATGDVFYLDDVGGLRIVGPWMACADGTGGGRSIIGVNTTNGQTANVYLAGILGEHSAPTQNTYGIYIGDTAGTASHWAILGCLFPNSSKILKTAALVNFIGLRVENTNNGSAGGGIDIGGSLTNSYIDVNCSGVTAGSFGENNIDQMSRVIEVNGEARLTLRDTAAAADNKNWMVRGAGTDLVFSAFNDALNSNINPLILGRIGVATTKVGFHGTAAIAKPTVTGSKGANAALTSLLTALANYGFIIDSSS